MMKMTRVALTAVLLIPSFFLAADDGGDFWLTTETLNGLQLRGIGPAISSGRISDIAVDPDDHSRWFVTVASGGVWRTTNSGTTWKPIFDDEGSYSIGCVTIDPENPNVVWVGTGENNSQRSVSFGDGVYKSLDGGSSWQKMGLDQSEHIGNIVVDPRDSDVVWVAAQGPLWRSGGDRGLYRTTDGGATWERVLHISDDTGIAEVKLHPEDPDTILATAYQRRRHTWTLINGGPESGLYKSTDGGETWREITAGLPTVDKGRMGLCFSPASPDVVYGVLDAALDEGGTFRSTDRGETWEKRSDHAPGGDYYNEFICDPANVDRVYSMDTWMQVTHDGGTTFEHVGETHKHVDNHALWINPDDPRHLLAGCDGGVYESFDSGATWVYFQNLPIMQFYRATVDNSEPFYYIYGGTQDNATLGGPTRTRERAGIANEDWFVTVFGDGFKTVVDPVEPNIVYSQWQYGGLVRFDRATGERVDIQPQPAPGEEPYRWNWDAPVIVSPHSHTRLYFAAQKLFRSDDRGNTWTAISEDLSRGIDRNQLEVMGKVWGVDALHKSGSTSIYGNAVALTESPLAEGVIYVGTDDGQIHATSDGGETWRTEGDFPGVPKYSYVAELEASQHDADTVYATFTNHKQGDFTPYVLVSTDRGRSWSSIRGDLPDREIAWTIAQDHVDADLLFLGTEFGLYVTVNGGTNWVRMKGGLPTIAVRDLDVQRRENDLALGTFGRGFYILDDYTPLRKITASSLDEPASLFPVKDALRYIETSRMGLLPLDKAFQGDTYYVAPNPPFGAVFTYHLKDGLKTRQERRHEAEKKAEEEKTTAPYPSFDALRAEDEEHDPGIILTVRDADGNVVQRVAGPRTKGFHRVAWDLRYPSSRPVDADPGPSAPWDSPRIGPLALPGTYSVTLARQVDGVVTQLAGPQTFEVVDLGGGTLPVDDPAEALAFQRQAAELQRAVLGAVEVAGEVTNRIDHLRLAFLDTPEADPAQLAELAAVESELNDLLVVLRGDRSKARRNEPVDPSLVGRINRVVEGQLGTTQPPTNTSRAGYEWASQAFAQTLEELRAVDARLGALEDALEAAGAPWTPGRFPNWPRGK
jgi:photosystem II stability/assembly factor-like uncharacterized protein